MQIRDDRSHDYENNKEKPHTKKEENKDNRKQVATCTLKSAPKSKNKPSKQKRDAAKRRQNKLQTNDSDQGQEKREESCNTFVMMDDNQGLDILPILAQYMTIPSAERPDKR